MVLLVELLLLAGILYGGFRLATRPEGRMSVVDPDRPPAERQEGPLTADELVALHIPIGFGYRKVDVDRLLDRVARQLPRAAHEPVATYQPSAASGPVTVGPAAAQPAAAEPTDSDQVSLDEVDEHG